MALNRPLPGQYNGPKEELFVDHSFAREFPILYEYLTQVKWDDGSIRQSSTLLLFVDAGVLRICVNDRDNSRSAFVTAGTFSEALASIEAKLCGETMDWRVKAQGARNGMQTPF